MQTHVLPVAKQGLRDPVQAPGLPNGHDDEIVVQQHDHQTQAVSGRHHIAELHDAHGQHNEAHQPDGSRMAHRHRWQGTVPGLAREIALHVPDGEKQQADESDGHAHDPAYDAPPIGIDGQRCHRLLGSSRITQDAIDLGEARQQAFAVSALLEGRLHELLLDAVTQQVRQKPLQTIACVHAHRALIAHQHNQQTIVA